MSVAFCDSSAIVKLIVSEPESAALKRALGTYIGRNTSELSVVEVARAVRKRDSKLETRAHQVLANFSTVPLSERIALRAAVLDPAALRSLDAIQLATALSISEVDVDFIAYDKRLIEAAAQAGLRTLSPS